MTEKRLHLTGEGQVRLELRHPWRDATTDLVFDPVEFLGRLAVLVPRPRINIVSLRISHVPVPWSEIGRQSPFKTVLILGFLYLLLFRWPARAQQRNVQRKCQLEALLKELEGQ